MIYKFRGKQIINGLIFNLTLCTFAPFYIYVPNNWQIYSELESFIELHRHTCIGAFIIQSRDVQGFPDGANSNMNPPINAEI